MRLEASGRRCQGWGCLTKLMPPQAAIAANAPLQSPITDERSRPGSCELPHRWPLSPGSRLRCC